MRRVPYGSEQHLQEAWPGPCADCGALDGQLHVVIPCALEECAKCGGQWPCPTDVGTARLTDAVWWVLERLELVGR